MLQYVIEAYSATAHQTIRQVTLNNMAITPELNKRQAEQTASAFAGTLNQQGKLQATDWVGRAVLKDLGAEFTPL